MDLTRTRHKADIIALWRIRKFLSKTSLELRSFSSREVVPTADDIASVCVGVRIEAGNERKYLCGVTTATEDDEEPRGRAAFAGKGPGGVDGGKDVEETELGDD